ncbi:hypothetical protein GJ904_17775 [Salmonella enterica]|nr:hypothetical protein [Salmonella enterica subsp. enterica serovar Saintpaul]EEC1302922.1 hypothetical protein [Salmonella enterica]
MDVSAFQQQLQAMMSGGGNAMNGSMGGTMAEFEALTKALQASNYQTDVAKLDQGGALGVQSLDTAMKTVIQENEHFTLFNRLAQSNAINVVDEYSRQDSVGGWLGGSTNTQMGVVRAAQGEYKREVGFVKFLMTLRQVGYVLNIGKNIAEPVAVEERNGALQLLTDANYLLYHGNAAASPTQYDGIINILDKAAGNEIPDENVVDMQGKPLDSVEPFSKVQVSVASYGSWGNSTDVFMPYSVQNDLNMGLDPAYRWTPAGQNTPVIGGQVDAIRLTKGVLRTNLDTFIQDETNPMVVPFELYNHDLAADNKHTPTKVDLTPVSRADSQFTGKRVDVYTYLVAGIDPNGKGQSLGKAQKLAAKLTSGQGVTVEITPSAGGKETGYAIYRGRQGVVPKDVNALTKEEIADFRLLKVIARDDKNATTTFTDVNRDIPGTVTVPMLNLSAGADAIGWRQFQPMTKIPLPFGVGGMPVMSWFQFLFGYLRVTKPKHHGMIKNILPKNSKWKPHGDE